MKKFSHTSDYTDYMEIVFNLVNDLKKKQEILDFPAGNGLLATKLSKRGHMVVCADINQERDDFIYMDLEQNINFNDSTFDTVICLEGLEHLINPENAIAELCRICKTGGRIIISLPNIQNMYSRLRFLCTGTFYQFAPYNVKESDPDNKCDRGHISPLSYVQLFHLFKINKAHLSKLSGDGIKKKTLIPFLMIFIFLGMIWTKKRSISDCYNKKEHNILAKGLFSKYLLFSRSLILVFEKI